MNKNDMLLFQLHKRSPFRPNKILAAGTLPIHELENISDLQNAVALDRLVPLYPEPSILGIQTGPRVIGSPLAFVHVLVRKALPFPNFGALTPVVPLSSSNVGMKPQQQGLQQLAYGSNVSTSQSLGQQPYSSSTMGPGISSGLGGTSSGGSTVIPSNQLLAGNTPSLLSSGTTGTTSIVPGMASTVGGTGYQTGQSTSQYMQPSASSLVGSSSYGNYPMKNEEFTSTPSTFGHHAMPQRAM